MAHEYRQLIVDLQGDVAVARLVSNRPTSEMAEQLSEDLLALVEEDENHMVLLNLSNVDYLYSLTIGKILALNKRLKDRDGRLVLCCVKPQVQDIFNITGLNAVLDTCETEQEAMEQLR